MSRRINRVEKAFKEELSEILQREIKDPRVGFVTITRVKVTSDLRHAHVYVSIMGGDEEVKASLEGLESARGYLRSLLGRHLRLKYLPEINFVHEHVAEEALKLIGIMEETERASRIRMEEQIEKAAELIREQSSALLVTHQHPDGDAIGSVLGLGLMLVRAGLRVQCSWPEPFNMPSKYIFLPGSQLILRPADVQPNDFIIALDCATTDRLEDFKEMLGDAEDIVNIDHHPDNSMFGTANIIDSSAAATAELIYVLTETLGLEVDLESATCLYAGIVTDTGRFQFTNTSSGTFRVASEMVDMGVDPNRLYENIYQNDSLPYLRLWGHVLEEAVFEDVLQLIYGKVTQGDLVRWGVEMEETEDLIDSLRALKGHRIAVLFKEMEDGRIRVSLRSRTEVDIGSVARRLGGGGHKVAAGYTSEKKSVQDALAELKGEIIAGGRDTGSR